MAAIDDTHCGAWDPVQGIVLELWAFPPSPHICEASGSASTNVTYAGVTGEQCGYPDSIATNFLVMNNGSPVASLRIGADADYPAGIFEVGIVGPEVTQAMLTVYRKFAASVVPRYLH